MKRMSVFLIIFFMLVVGYTTGVSAKTKPNPSYVDSNLRSFSTEEAKTIIANYHKDPNTHYQDMTDVLFYQLNQENPLLARELGKLPEFQDGISSSETKALENIVNLYNLDKDKFNKAFQRMYQVGIPEVREYCSPLQALFWIAEKEKFDESNNPLSYAVTDIHIMELVKKSWGDREGPRWEDIKDVAARLNSPELFNLYIDKNIRYSAAPWPTRTPRSVFLNKVGDCDDLANFGHLVLKKAGYKTFGREVYNLDNRADGHIGLGLKSEDGKYYLVVDFKRFGNRMSGPYDKVIEIDRRLGYQRVYRYNGRAAFSFLHQTL